MRTIIDFFMLLLVRLDHRLHGCDEYTEPTPEHHHDPEYGIIRVWRCSFCGNKRYARAGIQDPTPRPKT